MWTISNALQYIVIFLFQEECTCNYSDETDENGLDFNEKSKIRAKLLELHNEIETYQQLNARLSSICKERDDVSFPFVILFILFYDLFILLLQDVFCSKYFIFQISCLYVKIQEIYHFLFNSHVFIYKII